MQESEPRNGPERFQTAFIFTPGDPFCSRAAARARPPGFAFVFPSAARQCGAPQPLAPGPSGGDTAQRSAPRARSRAASRPPPRRYRGVGPRHVPITQQMRAATAPLTSPRSFQRRAQPVTERSPSTHKRPHGTRATTGAGKALNVRSHPQTAPGGTRRPGLFAARPSGRDADPAASRLPGSGRGQGPPPGRESRARPPRSFRGRAGPGRAVPRSAAPRPTPPPPAERSPRSGTVPVPTRCGSPWPAASAGACAAPASWRCTHAQSSACAPPSDAPGARRAGTAAAPGSRHEGGAALGFQPPSREFSDRALLGRSRADTRRVLRPELQGRCNPTP